MWEGRRSWGTVPQRCVTASASTRQALRTDDVVVDRQPIVSPAVRSSPAECAWPVQECSGTVKVAPVAPERF
jgi:hypothetical protein